MSVDTYIIVSTTAPVCARWCGGHILKFLVWNSSLSVILTAYVGGGRPRTGVFDAEVREFEVVAHGKQGKPETRIESEKYG